MHRPCWFARTMHRCTNGWGMAATTHRQDQQNSGLLTSETEAQRDDTHIHSKTGKNKPKYRVKWVSNNSIITRWHDTVSKVQTKVHSKVGI
jgi:hypothetical protein